MIYKNARLIFPNEIIDNGWISVKNNVFSNYGENNPIEQDDEGEIDCHNLYLSPGFIDLHTHGAGGHDFMDGTKEAFVKASQMHLSHGTTTLLPTTLTCSDEELFNTIDVFKIVKSQKENMPNLPGLHLEGPYFNTQYKGAQDDSYIRQPSPEHYQRILEKANGCISRWSVAPELSGAMKMGKECSNKGIIMSIAHSDATYPIVLEAVQNGYELLTHFYSAMSGLTRIDGKRILGLIECGYLMDQLTIEIIADGMHLPPELLRLIVKCKDNDKICLITDSMRAAGMPEGVSVLGSLHNGQEVIVEDGVAKLIDRSAYAGSVATADRLVRVMIEETQLPLYDVIKMITLNPANILGIEKQKGSLDIGKDADFILFNDNIEIKKVFVSGKECKFATVR